MERWDQKIPELGFRVLTLTDRSNSKQNKIVSSRKGKHLPRSLEWKIRCRRRSLRGDGKESFIICLRIPKDQLIGRCGPCAPHLCVCVSIRHTSG